MIAYKNYYIIQHLRQIYNYQNTQKYAEVINNFPFFRLFGVRQASESFQTVPHHRHQCQAPCKYLLNITW